MIAMNQLLSQILLNKLSFRMPTRIAKRTVDSSRDIQNQAISHATDLENLSRVLDRHYTRQSNTRRMLT